MVYASACVYRGKFGKHDSKTTGNPGSVIVPQYGSSLIIVFVWGKNTTLKFVGNMKLTLLLVVRLSLKLKRIFVIICSNSPSIQNNTHDRRHEMASQPPCSLSNTIFLQNSNSNGKRHARMVEIGQHQIQKSMKLSSQLRKRIQQASTNSKDIIQKLRPKWPGNWIEQDRIGQDSCFIVNRAPTDT